MRPRPERGSTRAGAWLWYNSAINGRAASEGTLIGSANWYAIHTKPHKEHAVELYLQSRGIDTFLPVLKADGRDGRQPAARPFFSCYLFASMDFDRVPLSSINWAPGVNRVVSFGGLPAVVPQEVVDWLRRRLEQVDPRDYHRGRPLAPGDRLRVTKGPLRGLEAIFDQRLSSSARARVFVEILGHLTACQMSLADLVAMES